MDAKTPFDYEGFSSDREMYLKWIDEVSSVYEMLEFTSYRVRYEKGKKKYDYDRYRCYWRFLPENKGYLEQNEDYWTLCKFIKAEIERLWLLRIGQGR